MPVSVPSEGRIPTPDQISLQDCPLDIQTLNLWGTACDPLPTSPSAPVRISSEVRPARDLAQTGHRPEDIQQMIAAAMQQSLAAHIFPTSKRPAAHSIQSDLSVSPERGDVEDALSIVGSDFPTPSCVSRPSAFEDVEAQEPELSEDEGLPPDQPAFTGLFPQALFKSLLFKAINTVQLSTSSQPDPPPVAGSLNPLFAEPPRPVTAIPMPPFFLDVIRKQWSSPTSAPVPSTVDCKNFTVSPDLLLVALLSSTSVPGDPEEGLRPEECRSEQVL